MAGTMFRDEPIITDDTPASELVAGGYGGLVKRDYSVSPLRPYNAVEMPLIPRHEWSDRIKEMVVTESRLSDIRLRSGPNGEMIPFLDQGQKGYCWAHGPAHAVMLVRASMGLPYVPLSAYAVAATIKKGRDEGGWGALALDFICDKGIPSQEFWPQGDSDYRKRGTPECWANAELYKVTESWFDAASEVWDRDLSLDQTMTLLLSRIPVSPDWDWWGHCVCLMDPVEVTPERDLMDPARWGGRIINSHFGYGDRGMAVIAGQKLIPNNAVAVRVVRAA